MLLPLTLLAACGLFNNATPKAVVPVVVAPPAPWQDAYVPGSLVEITSASLPEVWAKTRFDTLVGGGEYYWDKPSIPLKCPSNLDLAVNYLTELGECFCQDSLGEQVESPWADEPEVDEQGNRRPSDNGDWRAHTVTSCVIVSQHDGHWWRGIEQSKTSAIDANDEYNQGMTNRPRCLDVEFDGYPEEDATP